MRQPFILLDDARPLGVSAQGVQERLPSDARLYSDPTEIVIARRPDEVLPALDRIEALRGAGYHLCGHLAYEAGLVLEPRLATLAQPRCGADGPLIWFGAFDTYQTIVAADVPAWLAHESGAAGSIGPLDPALSIGGYAAAFAALQEAIAAGDIYQANLTFPLSGAYRGDPLALYAALRPAAGAGYGGVLFDGSHWLLSCSPELFFVERDGTAMVKPMKGTRPRSPDPVEDAAQALDLTRSVKDRAENLMIVDLLRNDLSRVAQAGSVKVDHPFAVESYPTVHQMVTTVRARLQPGKSAVDMLRALFPCGSITGAPKIRAMELIDANERDARGPYCGAIGRIDAAGSEGASEAAFNVAIRTLRLTPGENGQGRAVLGVGSAIVADSNMLDERRECLVKGRFVALGASGSDLIETMRFTPETGIALLDLHLERIKGSAAELGFSFDRHAVRNAIQALCFDAEGAAKVRLAVARSGAYCLELAALPKPFADTVACAVLRLPVDPSDWRLRHKTSDREFYDAGLQVAHANGAAEALFVRDDGLITEGCFTSIFVERDGLLLTPPLRLGLLPGVQRRTLIDAGRAQEAVLTLDDLGQGFLIGNALRGLFPAQLL